MNNPDQVLELVRSIEEKMEEQAEALKAIKAHAVLAKKGIIVEDIKSYKLYPPSPYRKGKLIVTLKSGEQVKVPLLESTYAEVYGESSGLNTSILKFAGIV